jgi:hypothetical protein
MNLKRVLNEFHNNFIKERQRKKIKKLYELIGSRLYDLYIFGMDIKDEQILKLLKEAKILNQKIENEE